MKWENGIFGRVNQADWIDVGAAEPTRQSDPIDGLFGDQQTDNLVAEWESIASEYQIPMMAQFHGFDTEAKTTFRAPVDVHNIEKGLIKVKLNQSERLRALTGRGVTAEDSLYRYVLQDGIRLADQVITRTKVAKNELMAYGKVTIKENNLDLTVDYGVPNAQLAYTIYFGLNADVPAQIQTIIDAAAAKGYVINGMLTSKAMLNKIRAHESIQKVINGTSGIGALVRQTALEAFFSEEYGITSIITNDLTYGKSFTIGNDERPVVTQSRYYPADKITFFASNPAGRMGIGLWGAPPEADVSAFHSVEGSSVSPYVYIMQWAETDPAVLWTKASALFMPVIYDPNSLFVATETNVAPA